MNATVESLEKDTVKVTVTATPEEVEAAISRAYADIAAKVRIPGFRKGKVPRPVLEANIGRPAVLAQASEDLAASIFPAAIEQLGLFPAEPAEVEEIDVVSPDEEFVVEATVKIRPEFELESVDGLEVSVEPATPSEKLVDAQIEYLRDRFATLEVVEDRGIEPEDFALLSFVGYVDGDTYENNEVSAYLYELGRGQMPAEFDQALLGARAGDEIVAEFPIPDSSMRPDFVGKIARFDINVGEVKAKVLPPVDEEFAESVGGFESVEDLRADIRKRLAESRETTHHQAVELEARKALAERLVGDVPEQLVLSRRDEMFADLERSLASQDLEFEQYLRLMGVSAADLEEDLRERSTDAVKQDLALEALFRLKGLEIAPDSLDEELTRMAERYEMSLAEIRELFLTRGMLPMVRLELLRRVAVDWLFEHVEVRDKAEEPAVADAEAPAKPAKATRAGTKKKSKEEVAESAPDNDAAAEPGEPAESTVEDA